MGVTVVDFGEGLTIPLGGGTRQVTVADVGPQWQCSGHDDNPPRPITNFA